MANVIQDVQLPTLVISPNKTLAAQLYNEFRTFFPNNTVHYFVSDYEYYQPEAYIPSTDTFIEKDVRINEEITRMRLASTASLISRRDVIVVASVSCLYGLGSPDEFKNQRVQIEVGEVVRRDALLRALVDIQYVRNDVEFWQGVFRARGDVVEVFPAYSENAYRIEFFGDEIDRISEIDTTTGEMIAQRNFLEIYPAKHFMTDGEIFDQALINIELELQDHILTFEKENKLLEAQRIEQRTRFDLEMLREVGYCSGIENYSRHLSGLQPGIHLIASCTISLTILCSLLMNPTLRFRNCAACIVVTAPERRRLSSMDSACRPRWTTAPSVSTRLRRVLTKLSLSQQHRVPMKWKTAHKSLSRLSVQLG